MESISYRSVPIGFIEGVTKLARQLKLPRKSFPIFDTVCLLLKISDGYVVREDVLFRLGINPYSFPILEEEKTSKRRRERNGANKRVTRGLRSGEDVGSKRNGSKLGGGATKPRSPRMGGSDEAELKR